MRFKRIIAFVLLAVLALGLTGCEFYEEIMVKRSMTKIFGVDLWDAELIEKWNWDTFESFRAFSVPENFHERLSSDWQPCPLTGMALEQYNDEYFFVHPRTLEKVVPWVANGFYISLSDSKKYCKIAILDTDTNILYCYICSWERLPKGM